MKLDIDELKKFLVEAKTHTYASGGGGVSPQRPKFKELKYRKGDFYYRDSYAGFYQAPGMEVVYFKEKPIWTMAYSGKIYEEFYDKADDTYTFLRKSMLKVPVEYPFRGPKNYKEDDFEYRFEFEGNIKLFNGREDILLNSKEVFFQDVIGGIVIDK